MSDHPPVPAGWYDDATDPSIKRYWDGTTWTTHTAPRDATPPSTVPATGGMSRNVKGGLIAGGIVLAVLLVAIVGSGIARSLSPINADGVSPVSTSATPTPTPVVTESPETVAPGVPEADVDTFKADSTRDLNDYEKDLNDMVNTVNEGGFWRLLSNTVELKFNLTQLESHDAPSSVQPAWSTGLGTLDKSITAIEDAIAADDETTIRAAIESSRAQVNVLRAIVAGAK